MHRRSQAITRPSRTTKGTSRGLVLAVALCGALAGASIVETIASIASHTNIPLSPDHLIAEPLALAGAICGGLLAAVLVSKDQHKSLNPNRSDPLPIEPIEVTPSEPMMWLPTPQMVSGAQSAPPARVRPISLLHANRITRSTQLHGRSSRTIRAALARPRNQS